MKRNDDARPQWLLREIALLSSARRARHGDLPESNEVWWSQILAVAADLGIETKREDWQKWPP